MEVGNIILIVIIHFSACLSVLKGKNKIINLILVCLYSFFISLLPSTLLTLYLSILRRGDNINVEHIMWLITLLISFLITYIIMSNTRGEKKIEEYILLGALYWKKYLSDEERIRKQKRKVIKNILIFVCLLSIIFIFFLFLIIKFKLFNYITFFSSVLLALLLSYTVFIHGEFDLQERELKKAIIDSLITLCWLFLIILRMGLYLIDITWNEWVDLLLLIFGTIFTIPSLLHWLKNVPRKLMHPYRDEVEKESINIISQYNIAKNKITEFFQETGREIKDILSLLRILWNNKEKKKVIIFVGKAIGFIILLALFVYLMYWLNMDMNNIIK